MPANIYNNIPVIEADGIICAHPHFMMVDTYRVLTDPMTSYWRLDKSIKRFQKLLKYYPIDQTFNERKIELKTNKDVLKIIRKKIIHMSELIVVGFYAFDYYVKKISSDLSINKYPYYEVITKNLEKSAKKVHTVLTNKFGNKINKVVSNNNNSPSNLYSVTYVDFEKFKIKDEKNQKKINFNNIYNNYNTNRTKNENENEDSDEFAGNKNNPVFRSKGVISRTKSTMIMNNNTSTNFNKTLNNKSTINLSVNKLDLKLSKIIQLRLVLKPLLNSHYSLHQKLPLKFII